MGGRGNIDIPYQFIPAPLFYHIARKCPKKCVERGERWEEHFDFYSDRGGFLRRGKQKRGFKAGCRRRTSRSGLVVDNFSRRVWRGPNPFATSSERAMGASSVISTGSRSRTKRAGWQCRREPRDSICASRSSCLVWGVFSTNCGRHSDSCKHRVV